MSESVARLSNNEDSMKMNEKKKKKCVRFTYSTYLFIRMLTALGVYFLQYLAEDQTQIARSPIRRSNHLG
jgi:hypothetical protein